MLHLQEIVICTAKFYFKLSLQESNYLQEQGLPVLQEKEVCSVSIWVLID
jgi:hypothetical protein